MNTKDIEGLASKIAAEWMAGQTTSLEAVLQKSEEALQAEVDAQKQFALKIVGAAQLAEAPPGVSPLQLVERYLENYFEGLKREMTERISSMERAVENLKSHRG